MNERQYTAVLRRTQKRLLLFDLLLSGDMACFVRVHRTVGSELLVVAVADVQYCVWDECNRAGMNASDFSLQREPIPSDIVYVENYITQDTYHIITHHITYHTHITGTERHLHGRHRPPDHFRESF